MIYIYILIAIYLIMAVLGYGLIFAYFQGEFSLIAESDYSRHRNISVQGGFFWFITVPLIWAWSGKSFKYGMKLK